MKRNDFLTKVGEGGVTKHIVKNRNTLFCVIYYSIWPNQGVLCLSVSTPDPQKVRGPSCMTSNLDSPLLKELQSQTWSQNSDTENFHLEVDVEMETSRIQSPLFLTGQILQ